MLYLALAADGRVYNLCDCGDFDAADESARDLGIDVVWIFDEFDALNIVNDINAHIRFMKGYSYDKS
jgi:hypothetical protein